ncbi:MAG: delta-lactam-biosynthetic de-N-acetylase [Clostridia bacterium]|nr:delta-lactam-biosynthetic de-N-acetylase [Clostridia bacterium]
MKRSLKNIKRRLLMLFILLVGVFSLSAISTNFYDDNLVSTSTQVLSNKKIEWGIQRKNNHEQPDVGNNNQQLISKYNGICLGNKDKKYIYLTFDLGYEAGYTNAILDSLKENNVNATFFITAHYVNSASDIVQRMIDEGHIVGNHTVNHKSMPSISDEELKTEVMTLHQAVYEKYGYEMKYIRPPKGEFSERTLSLSQTLGYKNVMWSFAYVDWDENKQPSHEEGMEKIISNLHNGEIMLLHATSKTNSEILSDMIKKVKEEGYEFRSIDDFVQ